MSNSLLVCTAGSTALALGALAGLRFIAEHRPAADQRPEAPAVPTLDANPKRSTAPLPPNEDASIPVIQLDELRVVGRKKQPRRAAKQARTLVPCSEWRALGPVFSAPEGTIPRQRKVQMLCPAP